MVYCRFACCWLLGRRGGKGIRSSKEKGKGDAAGGRGGRRSATSCRGFSACPLDVGARHPCEEREEGRREGRVVVIAV